MRREVVPARSGAPTLLLNGVSIHSRYDPHREALRHLETIGPRLETAAALIVIGEGLPYLSDVLRERLPIARVLSLLVGPIPSERSGVFIDATETTPGEIRRRVRGLLSPLDVGRVEVVLWEAGRATVPDVFRAAEREVLLALQDLQAQIATTGAFGMRWLTNALRIALAVDERWAFRRPPEVVSIVTSGPSIEPTLSSDAASGDPRRRCFPGIVMATSSALAALRRAGTDPDLVIHADGGFWAGRYLREAARHTTNDPLLVAFPSRAALPYRTLHRKGPQRIAPLLLATGWIGDELHNDYHEWPAVEESPTVTGTLLSFARNAAPHATLYVAGLDLCSRGLFGHARPHLNDRFMATTSNRLQSETTQRAGRVLQGDAQPVTWSDGVVGWQNGALGTFEAVIASLVQEYRRSGRIVPLYADRVVPPIWRGDRETGSPSEPSIDRENTVLSTDRVPRGSRNDRADHVRKTLNEWKATVREGDWNERTRELAFHLAPVEVLRSRADDGSEATARTAAAAGLDTLFGLLERLHG